MKIDLHIHTRRYSACSCLDPTDALKAARRAGLDGLVFTEHGILWPPEHLKPLTIHAAELGLVLLAGQEVTCMNRGRRMDFLVFGVTESLGTRSTPEELITDVHHQAGIVVAAHPFKPSRLGTGYHGAGEAVYELDLDGIELLHPDHDHKARGMVRAAAEARNLPLTGGSDAHEPDHLGICATLFERQIASMSDLVIEIKAGRVAPIG